MKKARGACHGQGSPLEGISPAPNLITFGFFASKISPLMFSVLPMTDLSYTICTI
jgi:hypothetical protein